MIGRIPSNAEISTVHDEACCPPRPPRIHVARIIGSHRCWQKSEWTRVGIWVQIDPAVYDRIAGLNLPDSNIICHSNSCQLYLREIIVSGIQLWIPGDRGAM